MSEQTDGQREVFQSIYAAPKDEWAFHDTKDPLTRYVRDRRLGRAMTMLDEVLGLEPAATSALVVCGGVGGEGTYLANGGFRRVTVSDISPNALAVCRKRDSRLSVEVADAECLPMADRSYDVVLVQDGLHHLPRPVLGFTEMLRVSRRAVVVIEPHSSLVGRLLGQTWEEHEGRKNYVFRWDAQLVRQAANAYLAQPECRVRVARLWDHNLHLFNLGEKLGGGRRGRNVARLAYAALTPVNCLGNQLVGVVTLPPTRAVFPKESP